MLTGLKNDEDIKSQLRKESNIRDPAPHVPEVKAWSMRPRDKMKEIGPEFKYGPKNQMQRVNEILQSKTNNFFTSVEIKSNHIETELDQ